MARFLIVLGLSFCVVGLLWPYLSKLGLGRLPGDIVIERDNGVLFPAGDVPAAEPAAQPRSLGCEPMKVRRIAAGT